MSQSKHSRRILPTTRSHLDWLSAPAPALAEFSHQGLPPPDPTSEKRSYPDRTVLGATRIPSFTFNSSAIFSSPHVMFSVAIVRISCWILGKARSADGSG